MATVDELPVSVAHERDEASDLGPPTRRFRVMFLPDGPVSLVRGCFHDGCEPCFGSHGGASAFCRYATGLEEVR